MSFNGLICELVGYAERKGLIEKDDRAYAVSRLLEILERSDFCECEVKEERELHLILEDLCDAALESGVLKDGGITSRDLFDTKLMGALVDRPSCVVEKFYGLYKDSPEAATDYFYNLSCDSNYIRTDRIKKDLKWKHNSKYGEIDITVNLSKPEKDPKAIAAARLLAQTDYPKCLLCHENEGFAGTLSKPARQNLRQIPFDMAGTRWYLQYSPYVYYNEHCIALSEEHYPMTVNAKTVEKILNFVETFPHYFIGSNAGLPVVGGSILSHDHMQGGRYTFAMEKAKVETPLTFRGFEDVYACKIEWPMAVIRLRAKDKGRVAALAAKIFDTWEKYSDESVGIYAFTDGEPHNAITPIARRRGEDFEVDLALRNNLTSEKFPLGIFHPHPRHHNIKKENIGLIEVMGLAVLPSRLKTEMAEVRECILGGIDLDSRENTQKHKEWFNAFKDNYTFTEENTEEILRQEIGKTFVRVLEDASVYKTDEAGRAAFMRYVDFTNSI